MKIKGKPLADSTPAGPDVRFSSFDAALNRAAAGERLQVLSPR
ncbi:MAG: hypothetical protein ACYC37_10735 [Desulfobacteria bacterium]